LLVELSAEATLICRDGKIAYINPAAIRLLGASNPEEVVGKAISAIFHPEARDRIGDLVTQHRQGRKRRSLNCRSSGSMEQQSHRRKGHTDVP